MATLKGGRYYIGVVLTTEIRAKLISTNVEENFVEDEDSSTPDQL